MSKSLNKAQLIGHLGSDPEVRYTPGGQAVANLRVATASRWKDHTSGEPKERTEWHSCVAWGKTAEIIGQHLVKGDRVYVEGELQTRKWTSREGQERYTTEIQVRDLVMLGNPRGAAAAAPAPPAASGPPAAGDVPFDDDIPY